MEITSRKELKGEPQKWVLLACKLLSELRLKINATAWNCDSLILHNNAWFNIGQRWSKVERGTCSWPIILFHYLSQCFLLHFCLQLLRISFPLLQILIQPFLPILSRRGSLEENIISSLQLCEELSYGRGLNVLCGSRTKLEPTEGNFRKIDFWFNTRINL